MTESILILQTLQTFERGCDIYNPSGVFGNIGRDEFAFYYMCQSVRDYFHCRESSDREAEAGFITSLPVTTLDTLEVLS